MFCGVTLDLARKIFPFTSAANLEHYLPDISKVAQACSADRTLFLIALATIRAETESCVPCAEEPSRLNTSLGGKPFDLYDNRRDLGNQGSPDGSLYRGRGYVQLTGRYNYNHFGPAIGLDLITSPNLATLSFPAAQILFAFLQNQRDKLLASVQAGDLAAARRCVNGGTHGLDRFKQAFQTGDSLLPFA